MKSYFTVIAVLVFLGFLVFKMIQTGSYGYLKLIFVFASPFVLYFIYTKFERYIKRIRIINTVSIFMFNHRDMVQYVVFAVFITSMLILFTFIPTDGPRGFIVKYIGVPILGVLALFLFVTIYRTWRYGDVFGDVNRDLFPSEMLHSLKNAVGAGPNDKVVIKPNGDLYLVTDGGIKINHGPYYEYLLCVIEK